MDARWINEDVGWVGAVDWDRRLFDELIPIPDGTSYNAYLVRGRDATALIDSVDPSMLEVLLARLASAGSPRIDFLVSQHAEQDHSGSLPALLERYPEAQVLATAKGTEMLGDHLAIAADRMRAVGDRERLDLGGVTLEFVHFPWVHWPETMLTWLPERRLLFSCDLFGSHLASGELRAGDDPDVLTAAKRYFAEIMMPFRGVIERHLGKVDDLAPAAIAPSHGPIHDRPERILAAYHEWVGGTPRDMVVVAYVSMHDSTRRMVAHLVEACADRGVRAEQVNLASADLGRLAMLLVDAATVVFGTPTVLGGPHPKVAEAAFLANLIRPKARYLSMIGSLGWGGKVVEQLTAMLPNLKAEVIPAVLARGTPKAADLAALDRLADEIASRHRSLSVA